MKQNFGHWLSDHLVYFASTWTFFIICITGITIWMWVQKYDTFDPFPFILLNLCLSCVAALQAPIILMSSRRQAEKDSERIEEDLKIDKESLVRLDGLEKKIDKVLKTLKSMDK